MKSLIVAFGIFLSGAIAASATPHAQFNGYFTDEGATEHAFGIAVPLKGTSTIKLSDAYSLELHAASANRSVAKLIDVDGTVVHESETLGPIDLRPSFAYQVCRGAVTFMSPAPPSEGLVGCKLPDRLVPSTGSV